MNYLDRIEITDGFYGKCTGVVIDIKYDSQKRCNYLVRLNGPCPDLKKYHDHWFSANMLCKVQCQIEKTFAYLPVRLTNGKYTWFKNYYEICDNWSNVWSKISQLPDA